jgi:hypothetical protein
MTLYVSIKCLALEKQNAYNEKQDLCSSSESPPDKGRGMPYGECHTAFIPGEVPTRETSYPGNANKENIHTVDSDSDSLGG